MLTLNFSPFPELKTRRLLLRRLRPEDAPVIFFLRSDPTVMRYIDREPEKAVEEALRHINRINKNIDDNEAVLWGIESAGALVGTICLWQFRPEHGRTEIGYTLHPEHWGKGFMKEAILAVNDYAFNKLGLHSIEAQVNPSNLASTGVLEATGYVKEAYFRENFFYKGLFLDTVVYSQLTPHKGQPAQSA